MLVFDASSMVYAWDNYPIRQFPPLWLWMEVQISENEIVMPRIAFEEVQKVSPDCAEWLKRNNLRELEINNNILQEALRIKGLLGIVNDHYHPKGVGENDILIIATACVHGLELISDEGRQQSSPKEPSKKKIPAVCGMREIAIPCMNFLEYLKRSNEVFR